MSASTSQALDYLEQLPGATHKKLYQQPSTALAVFRCMLPHLGEYMLEFLAVELSINILFTAAKTIVMAMLYMTGPFPVSDLDAWIRPDAKAYAQPKTRRT